MAHRRKDEVTGSTRNVSEGTDNSEEEASASADTADEYKATPPFVPHPRGTRRPWRQASLIRGRSGRLTLEREEDAELAIGAYMPAALDALWEITRDGRVADADTLCEAVPRLWLPYEPGLVFARGRLDCWLVRAGFKDSERHGRPIRLFRGVDPPR